MKENSQDMIRKKRWNGGRSGRKINLKIANEIRVAYATGKFTKVTVAKNFGLSVRQITEIVRGRAWPTQAHQAGEK